MLGDFFCRLPVCYPILFVGYLYATQPCPPFRFARHGRYVPKTLDFVWTCYDNAIYKPYIRLSYCEHPLWTTKVISEGLKGSSSCVSRHTRFRPTTAPGLPARRPAKLVRPWSVARARAPPSVATPPLSLGRIYSLRHYMGLHMGLY